MIHISVKVLCTLVVLASLVLPASALPEQKTPVWVFTPSVDDFDPLVDEIIVTVTIKEIRALEQIDALSNPDFYVKVTINNNEFISDVWHNMKYVENPNWSASCEVPKDNEFVDITIALWDKNLVRDRLCDISPVTRNGDFTQQYTAELTYSIAAGIWWGDDYLGDPSGYGRLNGCDDNSIYQKDQDCELWFDITQNDFDGDGFPYWLETNVYNTSPLVDNRGEDADQDGIPIEWEYTFGLIYYHWGHNPGYRMIYDPFTWEDHANIDSDNDGLNNIQEYKTWQWGSDPFRRDIFLEIDQMGPGPNGQGSVAPVGAYDLLRDAHAKYNIVWHVDDGRLGGGEFIPFKENIGENDLNQWYWDYFMHKDANNWRRGVFHWGIIGYNSSWATGFTFASRIGGSFAVDCFYLSSKYLESLPKRIPLIDSLIRKTFNREEQRALVYAGVIMHETGHSLNIMAPGVDVQDGKWPWEINYWRFGPYKSVMNYRYVYNGLVDYSDGSRGKNDYDDWANIDLTYFKPR
jgi:hypothetical protein